MRVIIMLFTISILFQLIVSCNNKQDEKSKNNTEKSLNEPQGEQEKIVEEKSDLEEAEEKIEQIEEYYNQKDFDNIRMMVKVEKRNRVIKVLKDNYKIFGKIKYSAKISEQRVYKGNSIIYAHKYEDNEDTLYVRYYISLRPFRFKIIDITTINDKDLILEYDDNLAKVNIEIGTFYKLLREDSLEEVSKLFDKEIVIDAGMASEIKKMILQRRLLHGRITGIKMDNARIKLQKGEQIVSITLHCGTEKNKSIYEEFWMIKRENTFKIFNYFVGETTESIRSLQQ